MLKRLMFAMALVPATCSAAELDVRFSPGGLGAGEDFQRELTRALRGNPARIIASDPGGGTLRLETTDGGMAALQADPRLTTVRRVDAPAAATVPQGHTLWRLSLNTAARPFQLSARAETTAAGPPAALDLRPGRLAVIARDAGGQEISRVIVEDPRIVRYEGIDSAGRFTTRRDLPIGNSGEISVSLPSDPRIKRIDIEADGNVLAGAAVE